MTTNDNYLWDKTGEPDAGVQQLEELLGTLKYQPQPLEIPATISLRRKRPFIPLAVAAAIALLMIGTALWIRFANSRPAPTDQVNRGSQSPAEPRHVTSPQDSVAFASRDLKIDRPLPRTPFNQRRLVRLQPRLVSATLTKEELAQKEQVLIALRLVSAKLNLAQRKAQSLAPTNTIRNQHKIG
ncbi:MAG TPA: hypothetical protein VE863_14025 [Pyrinomonadaceae bacterium]|jgi:hypothetical protein|nr:hypothetical protein [Pyrinomonadaceae bacterium]